MELVRHLWILWTLSILRKSQDCTFSAKPRGIAEKEWEM